MASNFANSSRDGRTRQSRAKERYSTLMFAVDVATAPKTIQTISPYELNSRVLTYNGLYGRITAVSNSLDLNNHWYFIDGHKDKSYSHNELNLLEPVVFKERLQAPIPFDEIGPVARWIPPSFTTQKWDTPPPLRIVA